MGLSLDQIGILQEPQSLSVDAFFRQQGTQIRTFLVDRSVTTLKPQSSCCGLCLGLGRDIGRLFVPILGNLRQIQAGIVAVAHRDVFSLLDQQNVGLVRKIRLHVRL